MKMFFYIFLKRIPLLRTCTAGNSMHTLLSNDVEQVNQLYQFIAAMKRYHEEVGNPGPGFPDSVCFFLFLCILVCGYAGTNSKSTRAAKRIHRKSSI